MHKLIKISTNVFDLTIKWNSGIMSLQAAILLGVIALRLFGKSPATASLALVILIADGIACLFGLLLGASFSIESTDGKKPATNMDTSVDRSAKKEKTEQPKKKSSAPREINNKVPIPTQAATAAPAPAPVSEPTPAPVEQPAEQSQSLVNKPVEEMTDADWDELFKI